MWRQRGLDMDLSPYQAIGCGLTDTKECLGMIEAVLPSNTTSGIQMQVSYHQLTLKHIPTMILQ